MKIGIMIDELASGSAPKLIGQEVRGLNALGHESEAIVIKKGYSHTFDSHLSGIPIKSLSDNFPPIVRRLNMRFPGFSFFSTYHIISSLLAPFIVQRGEWDVIVAHISYTCLTAKALFKSLNIPYFAFIGTEPAYYLLPRIYSQTFLRHLMPVMVPLSAHFDRYVVEDSLAIITYSKYYQDLITAYTNKSLEILHPGCFPVNEPNEKRENFILTFDRWDVGNTPNFLLDVLQRLNRNVKLVVAGYWHPMSIKEAFLSNVRRKGLSKRVDVIGPLNETSIMNWCSRALVHVHPNKEAFGMQSLEAAACGCPTVIPEGSGVTELFINGVHGCFPIDKDVQHFIDCIDGIVADPKKARKMGREAWKVARLNTWEHHAVGLANIIKKYVS